MEGAVDWFYSLPPITRTWFCLALLVHAGTTLDLLHPQDLLLDVPSILSTTKLELWRLLTCFLYAGGNLTEFHVLVSLYMIVVQSSSYEHNPFYTGGTPRADYVFFLAFCAMTTLVTYGLLDYSYTYVYDGQRQRYLYPLFTSTLQTSVLYLWSRRNPTVFVNMIVMPIQGQYVPFAHLAMAVAFGNPISQLVHGMFVGHIYYYWVQVVPALTGKRWLRTPAILVDIVTDIFGRQDEYRQDQQQLQPQQPPQQNRAAEAAARRANPTAVRRFHQEGATDAHVAAKLGNLDALVGLSNTAEGRALFGAKDHNDWQPLHEAVRGGYLDVVNFLLEFEGTVDKNARTQNGTGPSPLWLAESTHGVDHPVTRRLQELGALNVGPE